MTVVLSDTFDGTGAWDSAKWNTAASGAATFAQTGGYGTVTAPTSTNYSANYNCRTKATMTGGEYRYDVLIDSKAEYFLGFHACATGTFSSGWVPQNGYHLRFVPVSNSLEWQKSVNTSLTSLGIVTFAVTVGDLVHFAVRPGVGVYAWKNVGTRPATPTIASTDATYTSGAGGVSYLGGGTAGHTIRYDNVALDDLAADPPPGGTGGLRLGAATSSLRVGGAVASKVYRGTTQVWPPP